MIKKIVAIVAYLTLFLLVTVLCLYFLFPLERLREYIEYKAGAAKKYQLEIGSIERNGLGELVLTDVTVGVNKKLFKRKKSARTPPPPAGSAPETDDKKNAAEEKSAEEYSFIDIEQISVTFSLLEMLDPSGMSFGLDVELLDGRIADGEIELSRSVGLGKPRVSLPTIENLTLGDSDFVAAIFSSIMPSLKTEHVLGYLDSGAVLLEPQLSEDDEEDEEEQEDEETAADGKKKKKKPKGPPSYYTGSIEMDLSDITAMAPVLVQRTKVGAVEVPLTDMRLGNCTFKLRIDRKDHIEEMDKVKTKYQTATVVLFEKGQCKGESLDYYVRENSFILFPPRANFTKARMDLWTKLAFNPDYFEDKRVEDGEVVTRNKELGQGLEFDRRWQKSQDLDGFYWMHCKGRLSKPKCRRKLPPDEAKKKKAQKDIEKKRKAEEKKRKRDEARKKREEEKKKKAEDAPKTPKPKLTSAKDDRKERARKRADERRKAKAEARKKQLKAKEAAKEDEAKPEVEEEVPEDEYVDDEYVDDEEEGDEDYRDVHGEERDVHGDVHRPDAGPDTGEGEEEEEEFP
jgi:hypothetical protein